MYNIRLSFFLPLAQPIAATRAQNTQASIESNFEKPSYAETYRLEMKFKVGAEYQLIKEIGAGSYGEVVLARHAVTQKLVAIKKIDQVFTIVQDAKR